MSILDTASGEIMKTTAGGYAWSSSKTTTLAKTGDLELIRLVIPAGKDIPIHKAPGEITVQCLEGRVAFTVDGMTQELTAVTVAVPRQRCDTLREGNRRLFAAADESAAQGRIARAI